MRKSRLDKLSKRERESLLSDLVFAFINTNSISESALFLQDLLTRVELTTMAKRLRIAKLLLEGYTYDEIKKSVRVGQSTIAKISMWLDERGEGFRVIIKKLPKEESEIKEFTHWDKIKKRYPLYFWPELLLEEIIKTANEKQKKRLHDMVIAVKDKSELHRDIERLLKFRTPE